MDGIEDAEVAREGRSGRQRTHTAGENQWAWKRRTTAKTAHCSQRDDGHVCGSPGSLDRPTKDGINSRISESREPVPFDLKRVPNFWRSRPSKFCVSTGWRISIGMPASLSLGTFPMLYNSQTCKPLGD